MEKTPIQTTSRKCQNIDRHIRRRLVFRDQAVHRDLNHQRDQPDDAEGDVQAVRTDQREEGRQERAAGRAGTFVDQVRELIEFEAKEGCAEQAGDGKPEQRFRLGARSICSMAKP
jgi:hypothetical protein